MIPEGWRVITLEQASASSAPIRYGVVQIGDDIPGGIPIVPIKFIDSIKKSKLHRVCKTIERKYAGSRIIGGDVLLSVKGTIGHVGVVPEGFNGNIAREIARIRPNPQIDGRYLAFQLQSPCTQKQIQQKTVGTTRLEFSIGAVRKFPILLPPLAEQKRIAEILSTWDRAIETTKTLIANSEAQKKALMQQLLTGKKRLPGFSGEWKTLPLTQVTTISTGSSNRQDSLDIGKYVFFDRSTDIRRSNHFLFDKEAVIVGGEGQEFIPKYFKGKFDLHQRAYAIHTFDRCDGKYIFYTVHFYRHLLKRFAVGSTVPSLRMGSFEKVPVQMVSRDEQIAIGELLWSADTEIELLNQDLLKLRKQKSALMQQLLTGKRRVKIDKEVAV